MLFFVVPDFGIKIFQTRIVRHLFGLVGFLCFLISFNHDALKRYLKKQKRTVNSFKRLHKFHIYCGCIGFVLILSHTEFHYRGLPSLTFYALFLTVFTGLLGEFIFKRIPKNIRGEELTQEELMQISHGITKTLVSIFESDRNMGISLTVPQIREMAGYISAVSQDDVPKSWLRSMFLLFYDDILSIFRKKAIRRRIVDELPLSRAPKEIVMELIVKKSIIMRNIHFYKTLQQAGKYWRDTHKWLHKITIVLIVIHSIVGTVFFVP